MLTILALLACAPPLTVPEFYDQSAAIMCDGVDQYLAEHPDEVGYGSREACLEWMRDDIEQMSTHSQGVCVEFVEAKAAKCLDDLADLTPDDAWRSLWPVTCERDAGVCDMSAYG